MDSKTYWENRENEALKHYIAEEKEYDKELKFIYSRIADNCQKEIDAFYGKYAKAEKITLAEAKKRVSKLDIEAYERKAEIYVKAAARDRKQNRGKTNQKGFYFSEKANEEMRLYNATMKINRLEMLKANIGMELIDGHIELEQYMASILQGRTEAELKRQAGILGKTVQNNAEKAHAIVNASFKNTTFSNRIWMYQDIMKHDLAKLLEQGLIQGKNPRVLAKELRQYCIGVNPNKKDGGQLYNMERLMRTEMARVQTEAQKQSYNANGVEKYEFIANHNCCDICQSLDGKVFNVADMMPAENAAPMHPHCRCATAPWVDRAELDALLDYVEQGGTYEEWKKMSESERNIRIAAFTAALTQRNPKKKAEVEKGVLDNQQISFGTNDVDLEYIKSDQYRRKFTRLTGNNDVDDKIRKFLSGTLTKYSGTNTECLFVIDADTGHIILQKTGTKNAIGIYLSDDEIAIIKNYKGRKIGVHNHPTNLYPTGSDFCAAGYRGYDFGIIGTHDGSVYKYSAGSIPVLSSTIDAYIDKYVKKGYDEQTKKAGFEKALEIIGKEYDLKWQEIK